MNVKYTSAHFVIAQSFRFLIVALLLIFTSRISLGSPQLNSTFSATASTVSPAKQIQVISNGTVYVLGTSTTEFVSLSSDGNTATSITYNTSIPSHSNSDFVTDGTHFYIAINGVSPSLFKYSVSGSTASQINSVATSSGLTSLSFNPSGSLINTRGSALKIYNTSLSETSSSSISASPARIMANSSGTLYYISTAGVLRKSTDLTTSTDTSIASSLGSSALGLYATADGYVYLAHASTIRKINSSGTTLWSYSTTNLSAMTLDSNGRIYWINTSGVVKTLNPITSVSSIATSSTTSSIDLSWTSNVSDSDFSGVTIRRSTSGYPTSPTEGTLVTSNHMSTSYTDTGLDQNTTYYYTVFNETSDGYYSVGTTAQETTLTLEPITNLSANVTESRVDFSWTNPESDFLGITIVRNTSDYPDSPTDGTVLETELTGTTYSDTPEELGTYYYSFYVTDGANNYSLSSQTSATTEDTTPPVAPTVSVSVPPGSSTAELNWTVPEGASTFRIKRDTEAFPTFASGVFVTLPLDASTTTWLDTGLSDNTYYYSVFAYDVYGNVSEAGSPLSFVTVDTTAPEAPTITAEQDENTPTTILLSWTIPATTSEFRIKRSTNSFPDYASGSFVGSTFDASTTSYSDTELDDGTYYYSLFAIDAFGNISNAGSPLSAITIDTTPPSAPTVSAERDTNETDSVNLSWTVPESTNSFRIKRSTTGFPTFDSGTIVSSSLEASTTTFQDTSLSDGVYYYSVFALDSYGNPSTAGTPSSAITIDLTAPSAPTELTATVNENNITLTWSNPVSDFSEASITRQFNEGSINTLTSNTTETSYEDSSLEDGNYTYTVYAKDALGNMSEPATVSVVLDTTAPSPPTEVSAQVLEDAVTLYWINPTEDFDSLNINRDETDFPEDVLSGTPVASGITSSTFEDTVEANGTYYYSLFAEDVYGNISLAANVSVVVDSVPDPEFTPTVSTTEALSIDTTNATLFGEIRDEGTSPPTLRGFEYGQSPSYTDLVFDEGVFSAETFSLDVHNLECSTTYHFRAFATNTVGSAYGEDTTFTTRDCETTHLFSEFELELTQTNSDTLLGLGDNADFTLTIHNTTDVSAEDVSLSIHPSDLLQFVSATEIESQTDLDCSDSTPNLCLINSVEGLTQIEIHIKTTVLSAGTETLTVVLESDSLSESVSETVDFTTNEESTDENSNSDVLCTLNPSSRAGSSLWWTPMLFALMVLALFKLQKHTL